MQIYRNREYDGGFQGLRIERNGELLFHGDQISDWKDKRVLEMHSGDDRKIQLMYLMPLYYTFENGLNAFLRF